ncbi:ATP-dependent DNA helicase DinG [Tepidimonas taiwanensis]|uniref:ATP-dependent DNA helicase DinG n=1 Tax=Tepidimonas taiwanensis TaxID=307486 RepID=A0A554XBK3_9BURK|nr:ATP-dependent DNA helicase DinG [Tepidimonas taiwanensis]MCX7693627.1 ATP-dependent DNA helicase DinG [Tepidimonas taiwanensis]TSE33215.1 putative ATP-dependent helicase DinG [Tepidimonas taiwanensis]UBQ05890.1 ATP-dependent DNA helicase DinG [Tepidimonas taiwanensis]
MNETEERVAQAMAAFDAVIDGGALRPRSGQRAMAQRVAETLAPVTLGRPEGDAAAITRRIAVIQAGTGVGKSLAYLVPAIMLAQARQTRVVVSTATVALQEQLVHQDLPALARRLPVPFRFALAKGRGRYVCRLKLERWLTDPQAETEPVEEDDDLFAAAAQADRLAWLRARADDLAHGRWDGDRDSLPEPPQAAWWGAIAAEASSCTARHCPVYGGCVYFEQRKALVGAQVIVVNHDLLLSTLGSRQLPELDQCLLVLDEAHHLPAIALEQFARRTGLTRLAWIDQLASRSLKAAAEVEVDAVADVPGAAARLRHALQEVGRLVVQTWGAQLREMADDAEPLRIRLSGGVLPDGFAAPLQAAVDASGAFLAALRAIGDALRAALRERPDEAKRLSQLYAQLGTLAPRLEAAHDTARWLLHTPADGQAPLAKWFTLWAGTPDSTVDTVRVQAHASPIQPGGLLRSQLWSGVRGAILTSATLTSGGRFDFFLREVGLADDADVQTLEAASPFDHATQGRLVLAGVGVDPRHAAAYQQAVQAALLRDLPTVRHGALVLFTSRAHLQRVAAALPAAWRDRVLVQGTLPRQRLLARHRERVAAGQPSILFGLQSFGEGLDLPGRLCEDLFITKLPFAPPDDPVAEARAEWLRAQRRDPFMELVVPAAAIRLAQWIGRAIRTEDDRARIVCYDPRLTTTPYGRWMLQGLPPYTREVLASCPLDTMTA